MILHHHKGIRIGEYVETERGLEWGEEEYCLFIVYCIVYIVKYIVIIALC